MIRQFQELRSSIYSYEILFKAKEFWEFYSLLRLHDIINIQNWMSDEIIS